MRQKREFMFGTKYNTVMQQTSYRCYYYYLIVVVVATSVKQSAIRKQNMNSHW